MEALDINLLEREAGKISPEESDTRMLIRCDRVVHMFADWNTL